MVPHWSLVLVAASPFVGSFLGVVIDRLPAGRTVVFGRSACVGCGHALGPLELLPLISWMALRGRCRHCNASIERFQPAIELAAIAVAVWSVLVVPDWAMAASAALGWTLLVLSVIDWRHFILPDALTLPLAAGGLVFSAILQRGLPLDQVVGTAVGAAFLTALASGYHRWTGREGLGLGDAKLFAAAGAWLGWQGLPSVLLIGSGAGLAATLLRSSFLGSTRPLQGKESVPFGPYLALGIWLTWLYGPLSFE